MNIKQRWLYVPEGLAAPNDLAPTVDYLCHRIYVGRHLWHDRQSAFTNLKADYLRQIVPQYRVGLDWLTSNHLVETDRKYIIGKKSTGYKWADGLGAHRRLADAGIASAMNAATRETFRHYTKAHRHLFSWLPRFNMDTVGAALHIQTLKSKHPDIFSDDEYRTLLLESVRIINDKEFLGSVCNYGRVHTPYTSLLKSLRSYLSYQDRPLVSIDISNSQPLILASLLPKCFPIALPIPHSLPHDVKPDKETAITNELPNTNRDSQMPENCDIRQYVQLCEQGAIYEYLMDGSAYTNRQAFKADFYKEVLFGTGKRQYQLTKEFRSKFPNVYGVIQKYKRDDYRSLARKMQRAESKIMIDGVCYRLATEFPDIPVITIHDSIMTTSEHVATVARLITEEFAQIGLKPSLKQELV
jgi:hypothetical protein